MNTKTLTLSGLALSLFFSGCVGTGPNTQNGAVAGGALGALAGAVIGNNSRGGNGLGGALIGGAVGAIAGGTLGNTQDHQSGTVYGQEGEGDTARVVRHGPPPPPPALLTEVIPAAPAQNDGAIWIPGYWSFSNQAYTWVAGHWEVPPPNVRNFVTAHWEHHGHQYVWVQSYWQ